MYKSKFILYLSYSIKKGNSPNKLTRFLLLILSFFSLISCTKNVLETKTPVSIEQFKAFVSGKTFHVTGYWNDQGELEIPENTEEDVYSFGETLGVIDSKEPCIEYTVPLKVYVQGDKVMIDWVNLVVEYETFVVREVGGDYFILEGTEHSIKYSVNSRQHRKTV